MKFSRKTPYLTDIRDDLDDCSSSQPVVIMKGCSMGMTVLTLSKVGIMTTDAIKNLSLAMSRASMYTAKEFKTSLLKLHHLEPEKQSYKQHQANHWANKYSHKVKG